MKEEGKKLPERLDFEFNASPKNVFENFVLYTAISKYTPERETMLREIESSYRVMLEQNQVLNFVVSEFLLTELISVNRDNYRLGDMEIF